MGCVQGGVGTVPPDLILALGSAFDWSCVDEFWIPMHRLRLRLAGSWVGGSLLISLSLLSLIFIAGLRRFHVPGPVSLWACLLG